LLPGVDPSGGAGVAADVRTLSVHGAMALPVVTTLTVQNRSGMRRLEPVDDDLLHEALRAAIDDGPVHAIKTGLLAGKAQVEAVAAWLQESGVEAPLVVDPVLSATAGGYEAGAAVAGAYRRALVPRAAVFTPNGPELDAVLAAEPVDALLRDGCGAVLHKGGHGDGDVLVDRLLRPSSERRWQHRRRPVGAVHGTGCALSSAIAVWLARGLDAESACDRAIGWLQLCLAALPPVRPDDARPRPLPIVAIS
jgi:hydroxymethylpyrimidine/phosphomethylpyrimidine kinase